MPSTAQVRRTAVADQKIPLRVFLLGRIAVYHGERLIPPRVEPPQRRDTFQITDPRSAAPAREQAIEILLPEREPEKSAKAFNTVLHDLRRALSPAIAPHEHYISQRNPGKWIRSTDARAQRSLKCGLGRY